MACGSQCGCAPCRATTIGEFSVPRVVTQPSDIDALKQRLDPEFRATDASVEGCAGLQDGERKAWRDFYAQWRVYCDTPTRKQVFQLDWTGLFTIGAGTVYEDGLEREKRLHAWQQKFASRCALNAPPIDDPKNRAADLSAVKWIAAAGIAAVVAYVASPVLLPMLRRR